MNIFLPYNNSPQPPLSLRGGEGGVKKKNLKIDWFILFFAALLLLGLFSYLFIGWPRVSHQTQYGVTWSRTYARSLGLDSHAGLKAVLDDLGVRLFRIPAYWSDVEPKKGEFNWEDLTKELDLIATRGGRAIVVVGAKQPRWPEYWFPEWIKDLTQEERETAQLAYVEAVIKKFANHPAVEAWQVENEALFPFGIGSVQPKIFLEQEMKWAREVDLRTSSSSHPILTTDSGELSLWTSFRDQTDELGVSVYRVVVSPTVGAWRYWFLPPWFYQRKANLIGRKVFVSEFQMEPWAKKPLDQEPIEQQFKTFDLRQMQDNFRFAERMNMTRVYFWGVEWWLWMKERQNKPEFWNEAKKFLTSPNPPPISPDSP